jgi:recombinational DNA repair ATPase RecF
MLTKQELIMTNEEFQVKLQELEKNHRLREDLIKFKNQANNQLKAIQRRLKNSGYEDLVEYMLPEAAESKQKFEKAAKRYEKEMVNIVKELPLYDWYTAIDGCSGPGYAMILAEAGDPRQYANPAKLWKRMGLAVGTDVEAHKNKSKGVESGYSKRRRMIMYRIEDALVKSGKYYRQVYLDRKNYEMERDAEGYNYDRVMANKARMMQFYPSSKAKIKEGRMPQFVLALRAQRYMSKLLLRHLWEAWQDVKFEGEHVFLDKAV